MGVGYGCLRRQFLVSSNWLSGNCFNSRLIDSPTTARLAFQKFLGEAGLVELGKRYRAFISYSQQDRRWGKRLHRWLETYRVPLGAQVDLDPPGRLGRFFRDEEEMAAASNIADLVRGAIEDAENLVVVCSPRSAQSKWVNAEIHHFRRTGRGRKVFAFIIDGVPNSGDPATECFPPALRAAGDPDDPDALPIEPLGLDIRKDGRAKACTRLAAGLLGIDFDDLWQRERRRAEARQRWFIGGLGATTLAFAALAATAIGFGLQSQRRAAILSIETARTVLEEGDADAAALVLLEAAKAIPASETPDSLLIGFDEVLRRATIETAYALPKDARLFDAPHGLIIFDPATRGISLLGSSGPPQMIAQASSLPVFIGLAPDGALVMVGQDFAITRIVNQQAEILGSLAPQSFDPDPYYRIGPISLSADGVLLVQPATLRTGDLNRQAQVFDLATRTLRQVSVNGWGQVFYVRRPNGARFVFSSFGGRPCEGCVVPLDTPRPRAMPTYSALLSDWCLGGLAQDGATRARFERGVNYPDAAECSSGNDTVLVTQTDRTSRAPVYSQRLFSAALGFQPLVKALTESIERNAQYDPPPLRGTWSRNLVIMQLDDNALAVVSGQHLLVDTPERPLLELRLPGLIERIRLLPDRRIVVVEEGAGLARVIDYGAADSFGMSPRDAADATESDEPLDHDDRCPPQIRKVAGRELTFALETNPRGQRRLTVTQDGATRASFPAGTAYQPCASVSGDGRYVSVFSADGVAHVFDMQREGKAFVTDFPDAKAVVFLPNNRGLIVHVEDRFDLWERGSAPPLKIGRAHV